ncbi:MAG: YHYH protein [Chthoniobacter sp.]|nr:YHYH protein [Chthoniobacter sp.]
MKSPLLCLAAAILPGLSCSFTTAAAHDLPTGEAHGHYDWSVKPPETVAPEWFFAQADTGSARARQVVRTAIPRPPAQASIFELFAPRVTVRWDERYLFVESNGMPAHNMMVGITAWQQQVPLPQNYTGNNAWRIPLVPVPAKTPASIKGRFLRGAIALAANGIPIFNPQNNRGEVSAEIGELDQWGGHCGRADDYHYHAAPLHLQSVVGKDKPIAYALDGYPIYGLTEPDGSQPVGLDSFNGHTTAALGYHYHASTKYPYVNGGFHGEVVEAGGQVDPQPSAQPVRPAGPPLRGAKITGFETTGNSYKLAYEVNGDKRAILYSVNADGTIPFEYQNGSAGTTKETYTRRERGGGPGPAPREGAGPRDTTRQPGGDRAPARESAEPRPGGPGEPATATAAAPVDLLTKPNASFILTSPEVKNGGALPVDYTGDGSGATLPIAWSGAPAGTKSYVLFMHHLDPQGITKSYWILYNIPANVSSLPKNAKGVGTLGASFKGMVGYEPPHSKGPGAKTYVLTLYALSAAPQIAPSPSPVTYDVLLAAIKGKVLASADLSVVHTRTGDTTGKDEPQRPARAGAGGGAPPPRPADGAQGGSAQAPGGPGAPQGDPSGANVAVAPAAAGDPGAHPGSQPLQAGNPRPGGGQGGADNKGLIKPRMDDTIKVNIYADNWFVMFINGELVAVDSIKFTPHNVMSIDILPEYPMTIAIMAKDNADPKTGLEYGDHIGDGGFIIKFSDGTVSNATWKAKNFFKGPLNRDTKNPQVEHIPIPDKWWTVDFDDRAWPNATEFTEERVGPKEHFYKFDFTGAKFIWSDDLDLDNTVIFRTKIEKPGWKPRWNTHPDLDITGAPFK